MIHVVALVMLGCTGVHTGGGLAPAPEPHVDCDAAIPPPPAARDAGTAEPPPDPEPPPPPPEPVCPATPDPRESAPPADMCAYMDWELSTDGFYLVSRFGTTADSTTLGHSTTCGILQSHYDAYGCRRDATPGECLAGDHHIPWIQGHVDYDHDTVIATVEAHLDGDVPAPEYFYVAGAQRFGCGTLLRVSNPLNGRCVVAYAEDGGPGARYEYADRGARRILDSSPAVVAYLQVERIGWASADLAYVEWAQPGDVPGQACTPCGSTPARQGLESGRSPFDPDQMMPSSCRGE